MGIEHQSRKDVKSITTREGAKALVISEGTVLLVREQHADGTPFWTLPGGGIESSESSIEGLQRELLEELGCRAVIGEPIETIVYAHHSHNDLLSVYTVFQCEIISPITPNRDHGILEYQRASVDALPPRTLLPIRTLWD